MNLNVVLLLLVLAGGIGGTAAVRPRCAAAPMAAGARCSTSAADQTFSEPGPSRAEKDIRVSNHAMGWAWYGCYCRRPLSFADPCSRVRTGPDTDLADLVDPRH